MVCVFFMMPTNTLSNKLRLKSDQKVCILNPPANYNNLLGEILPDLQIVDELNNLFDFIHIFSKDKNELSNEFTKLKESIFKDGMIWISWPKKSSNIETNLNFNIVQDIGLKNGLVDVKVCAIDKNWSALKFVFRIKDRKRKANNE